MNEHKIQASFIDWFRAAYPVYALNCFSIPNGGKRDKVTAAILRKEGLQPGVPDLLIAVARKGYHGLFIELKTLKGELSVMQKQLSNVLIREGYQVSVCKGYFNAVETAKEYMNE